MPDSPRNCSEPWSSSSLPRTSPLLLSLSRWHRPPSRLRKLLPRAPLRSHGRAWPTLPSASAIVPAAPVTPGAILPLLLRSPRSFWPSRVLPSPQPWPAAHRRPSVCLSVNQQTPVPKVGTATTSVMPVFSLPLSLSLQISNFNPGNNKPPRFPKLVVASYAHVNSACVVCNNRPAASTTILFSIACHRF